MSTGDSTNRNSARIAVYLRNRRGSDRRFFLYDSDEVSLTGSTSGSSLLLARSSAHVRSGIRLKHLNDFSGSADRTDKAGLSAKIVSGREPVSTIIVMHQL